MDATFHPSMYISRVLILGAGSPHKMFNHPLLATGLDIVSLKSIVTVAITQLTVADEISSANY